MAAAKTSAKSQSKRASAATAASPKKTASKAKAPPPAPAPSTRDVPKYAAGDLISHPIFGDGIVTAIDADKLTIEFEGKIVKQIVDYYVKRRNS